jgi:hypothetical protein
MSEFKAPTNEYAIRLDAPQHYTFFVTQDWPVWARFKLGLSILLAPITLPLLGRTMRVTFTPTKKRGAR